MQTKTFTAEIGSLNGDLLEQFVCTFKDKKGVKAEVTNDEGHVVLEVRDSTPLGTNIKAVGLALAFAR